jgi:N-glycosylase/DNA lyase
MSGTAIVTDDDLARARQDPAFRHQLVADSLEMLLRELNRLRSAKSNAARARQIREGVELAVRLADLLQRIVGETSGASRAA